MKKVDFSELTAALSIEDKERIDKAVDELVVNIEESYKATHNKLSDLKLQSLIAPTATIVEQEVKQAEGKPNLLLEAKVRVLTALMDKHKYYINHDPNNIEAGDTIVLRLNGRKTAFDVLKKYIDGWTLRPVPFKDGRVQNERWKKIDDKNFVLSIKQGFTKPKPEAPKKTDSYFFFILQDNETDSNVI